MKQKLITPAILILMTPLWAQAEEAWNYRLSPYAWFAGVKGEASTIPGAPTVPIDVSSSEALSDSELSAFLLFEAKKHQHGILADFLYSDSQSDEDLISSINLTLKSISKSTIFSTAYIYEAYKQEQTVVDVYAGARYWKVDTELQFGGGFGVLESQRIRNKESWVDPLIGVKARTPLGNSEFYAAGGLTVGGLGIGSDSFYDISANIGYQWNEAIGTSLGYRVFDVDYEDGSFIYDMKQEGWLIGLTWAF